MSEADCICPTATFRRARDAMLDWACWNAGLDKNFPWPELPYFNWALDWFDKIPTGDAMALWLCGKGFDRGMTFRELSSRSNQVAHWLEAKGVRQGDRVFLMLGNSAALYEIMLACIKLRAVIIPGFLSLSAMEVEQRVRQSGAKFVVHEDPALPSHGGFSPSLVFLHIESPEWDSRFFWESSRFPDVFEERFLTLSHEPLFGYFTSGTTSTPKLVMHSHRSYPLGHLSSMYWNGVRPGDRHMNVSAPGWAKHSWSSFFVPWNAEATVVTLTETGMAPEEILSIMERREVTSFCAPPSTWRALVRTGLGDRPAALREITTAGEPLDPSLSQAIYQAWGLRLRDGFGQTETTAQIGHPPGTIPKPGTLGKPLPGYDIALVDPVTGNEGDEGEICVSLLNPPAGLLMGYEAEGEVALRRPEGRYYRTGDLAARDAEGYIVLHGRMDDLFKTYDHRISPFELEKALLEHPYVAEAAVVPVRDDLAGAVPKAFLRLAGDVPATASTSRTLFAYLEGRLAPEYRIRLIEFVPELPKTRSGKIQRRLLRDRDAGRRSSDALLPGEFRWQACIAPAECHDEETCHA